MSNFSRSERELCCQPRSQRIMAHPLSLGASELKAGEMVQLRVAPSP